MTKKAVFDKPLDCKSEKDVDKTWRQTIVEGLEKNIIKDGIFFGTPHKKPKDGKPMMVVAVKSDTVEPEFICSVMEMLPRTFLMKMAKIAVWSEKGQYYGAELMEDKELKAIISFLTKVLLSKYMEGLDPKVLFPNDKNLQKRWNALVAQTVKEEAEKLKAKNEESSVLEKLAKKEDE